MLWRGYVKCICEVEPIGLKIFSTTQFLTVFILIPPIPSVSDSSSWEWKKENTNGRSKSREGEYCRQHEQFPSTWCSEQINSAFVRPWELNPVGHVANLRLNKRMTGFGKRAAPDSHVYIWLWLRQDRSTEKPLHLSSCLWIPLILTFHLYHQNCWNKISLNRRWMD